jgi:polyisoprenoid-binding protein YceI
MTIWNFDTTHSSVNFHVRHLMVSKVHGRFASWSGNLVFDPEDPTRSSVEVVIDAGSVDTKEPKRDEHLRSPDFFDVEKYPQLTFKSTKVDKTSDDTLDVHGDLTIHGVTRPVVLTVEIGGVAKDPWGGTRAGFSAKTSISRKDFGLTWNVALETGGILVGDKIDIGLEIEAIQAAQKAA